MSIWRSDFQSNEISFIVEKINSIRRLDENGNVSLKLGQGARWISVLASAINFPSLSDAMRIATIKEAIYSTELATPFTEKEFRDLFYRTQARIAKHRLQVFRVAFPIWNLPNFLAGKTRIGQVSFNFSPKTSEKYLKTILIERRMQQEAEHFSSLFTKDKISDLSSCTTCIATLEASSAGDAYERASGAMYELLGVTNLAADSGKYWRLSLGAKSLPISEVLIGPHISVHHSTGQLAYDGFWHDDWNGGPKKKPLRQNELLAWERRRQQLNSGLSKSRWKNEAKFALSRYYKAFSAPNLEQSFLEGWRLFELISGERDEKTDVRIRRASSIYESYAEHMVLGRHLAFRRNTLTHGHEMKYEDEETLAFQMLELVVPFLQHFILNPFRFESTKQLWEFLDLPVDRNARVAERRKLGRRIGLLTKASQFRGES